MIGILFLIVSLFTVEQRLESESYRARESAEKDLFFLWLVSPNTLNRLCESPIAETRTRAVRARGRAIARYLDSLGEPPWCDWPLYCVVSKGWVSRFPEFSKEMHAELPWAVEDRYSYDYNRYRVLQKERARAYLERGGLRSVVEVDYFLGRLVERDYFTTKAEAAERGH